MSFVRIARRRREPKYENPPDCPGEGQFPTFQGKLGFRTSFETGGEFPNCYGAQRWASGARISQGRPKPLAVVGDCPKGQRALSNSTQTRAHSRWPAASEQIWEIDDCLRRRPARGSLLSAEPRRSFPKIGAPNLQPEFPDFRPLPLVSEILDIWLITLPAVLPAMPARFLPRHHPRRTQT